MKPRYRRMIWILVGVVALGVATTLVLNAFRSNLVFFYSPITHVGIYVGGGLMVHAANPREGVRVDSISDFNTVGVGDLDPLLDQLLYN